jgi:hypothetical protein
LVGDHLLFLREFGHYVIIFKNVCAAITVAMVRRSFAVKEILGFMGYYNRCHDNAVKGGQAYYAQTL